MIGTRVGPYEIVEEIGKGGMATVFRAYQPSIDRFVAIKIIHLAISIDRSSMERFQREAKLVARLEHPHLLPVYDYDGAHNPPYIVMRYLEGGTLKDVITAKGALPIPDIVHIIQQIASALDYAHRQGVIHRDIKPTNIMIDQDGNAFLMDFGIARMTARTGAGEGLTQTGFAVGTPSYMSPEQGMGAADISPQADIYSLGVVAYQMATGALPYSAETPMAIVLRHINDPVPSARAVNPSLPIEFDQAIAKAMAKKATDRHATAGEFAEDLARAIAQVGAGRRPDVLRSAAQENVTQLRERRAANQQQIEATMAQFESARVKAAQAAAAAKQRTPPPPSNTPPPTPVVSGDTDDAATLIYTTENQPVVTPSSADLLASSSETSLQTPRTPAPTLGAGTAPTTPIPAGRNRTTLILIGAVIVLALAAVFILMQTLNQQNTNATNTAEFQTQVALAANATETGLAGALADSQTQTAQAALVLVGSQTPEATISGIEAASTNAGSGNTAGLGADETPEAAITVTTADLVVTVTETPTEPPPTPTNTIIPSNTPIPTPATPIAIAARALVLRQGPSLSYDRAGALAANDEAIIIGTTEDGGWYQVLLPDGSIGWLSTSFVDEAGNLNDVPFVEAPTFTPTFTDTPTLTFTPSNTPTPSDTPTPTETYTSTFTNTPTPSNTPTETPTFTLTPSDTPTPTLTFTPSDTPTPTSTPTPIRGFALTLRNVAVRSGPGSEYQEVGTLPADSEVLIIGKTADLRWLLVVMPDGRSVWLANSPLSVRTSGNITDPPVIQAPTITPTP